jgi:hypothetical protein
MGFSRQLTAASIGPEFFSSEALSSMQAVYRWSIPTTAISDPRFGISDYATADIVTVRISCSPDDPLGPVARSFATIDTVLAAQRPLVVAIFAPLAIWSSTQVGAGMDLKIKHISKRLDGCRVSIISPVEVASRLAFKESIDFSESMWNRLSSRKVHLWTFAFDSIYARGAPFESRTLNRCGL